MKHSWHHFLLVIIFIGGTIAHSQSNRQGTIATKDGDVFVNVSFSVDNVYKVLKFTSEGSKKTVSFTDIVMITNSNGDDITEVVLGKYYYLSLAAKHERPGEKPVPPTDTAQTPAIGDTTSTAQPEAIKGVQTEVEEPKEWKSKTDVAHSKREPLLYSICFRPHLSLGTPTGDYYRDVDPGVGGGADISIPAGEEIAVWFSLNKVGIQLEGLSTWSFQIGAEYYHTPETRRVVTNLPSAYFAAGLGALSHSGELIVNGGTKFSTSLSGGFILPLGKSTGIDIGGDVYLVYGTGRSQWDPNKEAAGIVGYVFQFHIGLALAAK